MRYIKKNKKKVLMFLFLLTLPILLSPSDVFALSENECWNVISKNRKFFTQNKLWLDAIRWIGWMIITGLKWLADQSQALYMNTIGLLDFTNYSQLNDFVNGMKYAFQGILAISIMWLGITMIVNHKKTPHLLTSILIAALSVSALGTLMLTANSAVTAFCGAIVSENSFSDTVINDNFYDLMYIDKTYGLETLSQDADYLSRCHYPAGQFDIENIDINAVLNYSDSDHLSSNARDILSYKFQSDAEGGYVSSKVYNGFGWNDGEDNDFFNEFYYRYKINGFPIVLSLISINIVFLCLSYKTMRLIYELAVKKVLAYLYSADLTGVQKTLKILGNIKDSYIIIMLTSVLLKVFQLAQSFLSERFSGGNSSTFCILLLFTSLAIVDGPNIIQTLTGEDAGLQSGFSKMVSLYRTSKGVTSNLKNGAKGGINSGINAKRHSDIKNAVSNGKEKAAKIADDAKTNIKNGASGVDSNKDIKNGLKGKNPNMTNSGDNKNKEMNPANREKMNESNLQSVDEVASGSDMPVGNETISENGMSVGDESTSGSDMPVEDETISENGMSVGDEVASGSDMPVGNETISENGMSVGDESASGNDMPVGNETISKNGISAGNEVSMDNEKVTKDILNSNKSKLNSFDPDTRKLNSSSTNEDMRNELSQKNRRNISNNNKSRIKNPQLNIIPKERDKHMDEKRLESAINSQDNLK